MCSFMSFIFGVPLPGHAVLNTGVLTKCVYHGKKTMVKFVFILLNDHLERSLTMSPSYPKTRVNLALGQGYWGSVMSVRDKYSECQTAELLSSV